MSTKDSSAGDRSHRIAAEPLDRMLIAEVRVSAALDAWLCRSADRLRQIDAAEALERQRAQLAL